MTRLHPKLHGELAEALFLGRAVARGLRVSKPWGDSCPYDFLVETTRGFLRVQVKSARAPSRGCYRVAPTFRSRKQPYTRRHIDFIAAYIAPADTWYIIPVAFLRGRQTIWFCPADPQRKPAVEPFREAWHLLGGSWRAHLPATVDGGRAALQGRVKAQEKCGASAPQPRSGDHRL